MNNADDKVEANAGRHPRRWDRTVLKQAATLAGLNIVAFFFMIVVIFALLEGILGHAQNSSIFLAIINALTEWLGISAKFGLMVFAVIVLTFFSSYMHIARQRRKYGLEIANMMYKDFVYWSKLTVIWLVLTGIVWLLMCLLFVWSGSDFFVTAESLVISALITGAVLFLVAHKKQ